MSIQSEKTMFEIYQTPPEQGGLFEVIYYTELTEHNRDKMINRAMQGVSFLSGFIKNFYKDEAKQTVQNILDRLNAGEKIASHMLEEQLKPYYPKPT